MPPASRRRPATRRRLFSQPSMAPAVIAALLVVAAAALGTSASTAYAAPTAEPRGAHIVAERRLGPRVIELTVATQNFTAPTKVMVDLPTAYDAERSRRWAVTFYLAGTGHIYSDFNTEYDGVALSAGFPSVVVSPNGDSGYWSDWFNSGKGGPPRYESFVVHELIPLIDHRFRTSGSRAMRAVMGESMGGYGAMMLAARHPDLFAAASSLSGAVDSNLPANGAVLSASPTLQGAAPDAIYGPRAQQEVRWRGHNPTDLAANLRPVALQVRSAAAVLDPALGEGPTDAPGCAEEAGVDMATTYLHQALRAHGIAHLYQRYPTGCHTVPNFERQITATFKVFARQFARPAAAPSSWCYRSIAASFDVFGWRVRADPARALEFLQLRTDGHRAFTLTGSGRTTVTTASLFAANQRVTVIGGSPATAVADAHGRLLLVVDLGAANTAQQYTPGAHNVMTERTVRLTASVPPRP